MDLVRSIVNRLRRSRRPPSPSDPQALGAWGEDRAVDYLRRHGYRILYRRYRARGGGEVDIVARDKAAAVLCFIEVKTRWDEEHGRPSRAVDEKKRQLILHGALSWLRLLNHPDVVFRFDIVEVVAQPGESEGVRGVEEEWSAWEKGGPGIRHLTDAFTPPGNFFY